MLASLRISVIQPADQSESVPVVASGIRCDQMLGVELTGPLDSLLDHVAKLAARGIEPDAFALDLVLHLRPKSTDLESGSARESSLASRVEPLRATCVCQ